jgi:hypothetical protein
MKLARHSASLAAQWSIGFAPITLVAPEFSDKVADEQSIGAVPMLVCFGRKSQAWELVDWRKPSQLKEFMKALVPKFFVALSLVCLCDCSFLLERPQPGAAQPMPTAKLEGKMETFTGKVVIADGAYRFNPFNEPDRFLRLTRAKKVSDFASEQLNLRKYYEKTISVKGKREGDWLWAAAVIGQWLQPGEATGPNMKAPPVPKP